jgi:hypothetical protein
MERKRQLLHDPNELLVVHVDDLRTLLYDVFMERSVEIRDSASVASNVSKSTDAQGTSIGSRLSTKLSTRRKLDAVDLVCQHFDPQGTGIVPVQDFLKSLRIAGKSIEHETLEAKRLFAGSPPCATPALPLTTWPRSGAV